MGSGHGARGLIDGPSCRRRSRCARDASCNELGTRGRPGLGPTSDMNDKTTTPIRHADQRITDDADNPLAPVRPRLDESFARDEPMDVEQALARLDGDRAFL